MANVSGREDARHARLQRKRVAIERPSLRALAGLEQVGPREDEAGPVGPDVCTSSSATAVERPSEAPYTAAASPAGPAPTITRS